MSSASTGQLLFGGCQSFFRFPQFRFFCSSLNRRTAPERSYLRETIYLFGSGFVQGRGRYLLRSVGSITFSCCRRFFLSPLSEVLFEGLLESFSRSRGPALRWLREPDSQELFTPGLCLAVSPGRAVIASGSLSTVPSGRPRSPQIPPRPEQLGVWRRVARGTRYLRSRPRS